MRAAVVGGGPAGLATAALLRRTGVADEVVLWERDRGRDPGFGVILPPEVRTTAARIGPEVADGLAAASVRWRRITVRRGDETWTTPAGPELAAIARSRVTELLSTACDAAGVRLRDGLAPSLSALARAYDLVVCADGAGSAAASAGFDVEVRALGPSFVWLGLDEPVDGLQFITGTTVAGTYTAHAYPYSESASTFLVEGPRALCTEDVSALFGRTVRSAPGQDEFDWRSFRERTVHPWSRGNVVLVGDAAHTTHYSIGYGTRLALDDAVALVDALAGTSDRDRALRRYEAGRRPVVERTQDRGRVSAEWFSLVGAQAEQPILRFAANLLTRGGRLTGLDDEPCPGAGSGPAVPCPDNGRSHS